MKLNKLFVLICVVTVLVAGLVVWRFFFLKKSDKTRQARSVVAVEVVEVKKQNIYDVRYFTGTLSSDAEFMVAPRISGWARKIYFNVGDEVKNDDVVVKLDEEELRLNKEQVEAELEVARANLAESESMLDMKSRDYQRASGLHMNSIMSSAEFERITADFKSYEAKKKVTEAQVKLRETMLEMAELKLSYTSVTATWSGGSDRRFVGERYINEGSLLQANTPVMTLIDLDTMKVVVNVIERDIPFMFKGQKARIYVDAFKNKAFDAEVIRISPFVKEKSRQGAVELSIDNKEHKLKPGMFVTAEIEFNSSSNANILPVTTMARRNDIEGVFMVQPDSKVKFVPVKTGITSGNYMEIISPEDIKGQAVTMGHHLLEDGATVLLPKRKQDGND